MNLHSRRLRNPRRHSEHEVIHIARLPIGLSYPAQVAAIVALADNLDEAERPTLVLDATGVGRAITDMVRAAWDGPIRAVVITGGDTEHDGNGYSRVPKADLVACLEAVLSSRRLHARPGLPLASELEQELREFGYELGAAGRPRYEGRGAHDDLVMSLSLALHAAERRGGGASFVDYMRGDIARQGDGVPAARDEDVTHGG